jgi:leucyl-tRNA synthetase
MGKRACPRLSPCGVFPVIHWEDGEISTVDDSELPVLLPELKDYKPGDGGQSPLDNATEWLQVTDKNVAAIMLIRLVKIRQGLQRISKIS